jgi:hypothetical protein
MSKIKLFAVITMCAVLAGAAYAAPGRGGGGGHPGGGGGAHFGGGGGMRMGGGGAHFGGGGMRMGGGGQHFGGGARMGGMHGGGGPRFSGRPASAPRFAARPGGGGPRSFAGRSNRFAGHGRTANINPAAGGNRAGLATNRQARVRSNAIHNALRSRAVAGAMHRTGALRSPNTRAHIAAAAAIAGWHEGRGHNGGWWRHRNGGYGWVGPVFWPFAYDDLYDYTLWGYGDDDPFWGYGYGDIYAGLFSPYDYDALAGYWPQGGGGSARRSQAFARDTGSAPPEQLVQMCGQDKSDIAGLPLDRIQKAIQPNDAQRAALDDLASASAKAAQDIKAACPSQIALTAPARLADMQTRIEAMIAAVGTVQPPLQKFYDLLNDDQKTRLNALGRDERQGQRRTAAAKKNGGGSLARSCGAEQANIAPWPSADIDAKLHPTEAQRASLTALQDATAKASDTLKAACPPNEEAITPTARLEAAGRRLDVLLQAVKSVRTALDDFYGKLTDEQKAQFEAIGPNRQASAPDPSGAAAQSTASAAPRSHHRRHASVGGMIRRLMSAVR